MCKKNVTKQIKYIGFNEYRSILELILINDNLDSTSYLLEQL